MSRRRFLHTAAGLGLATASLGCLPAPGQVTPVPTPLPIQRPTIVPAKSFTDWGWPLPYAAVSVKSVDWLQAHNWWPLVICYQPLMSGFNACVAMMTTYNLLGRRGIEVMFHPDLTGLDLAQSFVAGEGQAGAVGVLPSSLLIDRGVPVNSVAIITPNLKTGTVVPNGSPIQRMADFRGSGDRIGVSHFSDAVGYLVMSASMNGLVPNRDFFFDDLSLPEQSTLPDGVAAVAPWDPTLSAIVDQNRTGRLIDNDFPYHFDNTHLIVRRELIQYTPDVVQALVDTYQESILLVRLRPRQAADVLAGLRELSRISLPLLAQQTIAYNSLYKPTFAYPFPDFWPLVNGEFTSVLSAAGQLSQTVAASTWRSFLLTGFMDVTYERLGWRRPDRPPWIPPNWTGEVGNPPYPPYETVDTLKAPQPWPAPSDLTRPWTFAGTTFYP